MASLSPTPKLQFFDNSGNPLVGGKLYTYLAGTLTPSATFTDSTGTAYNSNPVILDSRGEASVWLGSGVVYKFALQDAGGVPIYTVDNVSPATSSGGGGGGTASVTVSDTAPTGPTAGNLWWKSDEGQMYIYYTDVNSSQWVVANAYAGGAAYLPIAGGTLTGALSGTSATFSGAVNGASGAFTGAVTGASGAFTGAVTGASGAFTGAVTGQIQRRIQPITASVASNALTLTLNPTALDFRSSTLASGTVNTRIIASAISVVVPSSATLGTVNATAARLAVLALDNSGTVELAVVNIAGGNQLDETNLISTTAISAAATASNVIYSTTARTSVPYCVVGFVDITETTAGTWATAPSTIQGTGGQALAALSSIGYGQTWQSVTRTSGTTYYNTTGKPIMFNFSSNISSGANLVVNGVTVCRTASATANYGNFTAIIPVGASYVFTLESGSIQYLLELR